LGRGRLVPAADRRRHRVARRAQLTPRQFVLGITATLVLLNV
jgi:hypothetical protein